MKRFLTGLLAAVAVLALAVPVSAADNTTTYIDVLRNKLVLGPQATTPSVATGGRIGVNQFGVARVYANAAAVSVTLQAGTVNGQVITVINSGSSTITFDAQATSLVAGGTGQVIPPVSAQQYIWDTASGLWFPIVGRRP
mgnify:CR=1 FL=1